MTPIADVFAPQCGETAWIIYDRVACPIKCCMGSRRCVCGTIQSINLPHLTVLTDAGDQIPFQWQPGCDKINPVLFVLPPSEVWPTDVKRYVADKPLRVVRNPREPGFQLLCPMCYTVLRAVTVSRESTWFSFNVDDHGFCIGKPGKPVYDHVAECDCIHSAQYPLPTLEEAYDITRADGSFLPTMG